MWRRLSRAHRLHRLEPLSTSRASIFRRKVLDELANIGAEADGLFRHSLGHTDHFAAEGAEVSTIRFRPEKTRSGVVAMYLITAPGASSDPPDCAGDAR